MMVICSRTRHVIVAVALVVGLAPLAGEANYHIAPTYATIYMNNLRFCEDATACLPTDMGHVTRIQANVPVTLTFVYTDTVCDLIPLCPGHSAVADDASFGHMAIGKSQFVEVVTFAQGRHAYRCTVHGGYGMTGAIDAV